MNVKLVVSGSFWELQNGNPVQCGKEEHTIPVNLAEKVSLY